LIEGDDYMLKRNDIIMLKKMSDNSFNVMDRNGEVEFHSADDDFFIYLSKVSFRADRVIMGQYLGEASSILIDDHCKDVACDEEGNWIVDGNSIKLARMVAINNKVRAVVVLIK
jgi:hypothetical protein